MANVSALINTPRLVSFTVTHTEGGKSVKPICRIQEDLKSSVPLLVAGGLISEDLEWLLRQRLQVLVQIDGGPFESICSNESDSVLFVTR